LASSQAPIGLPSACMLSYICTTILHAFLPLLDGSSAANVSKDGTLHNDCCENLISYFSFTVYIFWYYIMFWFQYPL
jgi:hypothetical protein